MTNNLGHAIRAARENAGLNQTELAKAIGITQPRISAMEREDATPSLSQLEAIERALRLERGFLLRAAGQIQVPGEFPVDPAELTMRLQRAVNELGAIAKALGYRLVPQDED